MGNSHPVAQGPSGLPCAHTRPKSAPLTDLVRSSRCGQTWLKDTSSSRRRSHVTGDAEAFLKTLPGLPGHSTERGLPPVGGPSFTPEKVPRSEPPPCPSAPLSRAVAGRRGAVADTAGPARPREHATLCPLESRLTAGPPARLSDQRPGPGTQKRATANTEVSASRRRPVGNV